MRYINIDLSSDNHLQEPQIFGGYAGEHNETVLQVKLPNRMVDIECSGYRFDFQTSEDNKISSPLIPVSELHDGVLLFKLTEQLTVAGKLLFNVAAILSDENLVYLISKTNRVILHIEDSPEGNALLIDPNGYKDELQKMVDERILQIGTSGVYVGSGDMPDGYNVQIDPNGDEYFEVEQSFNPNSTNPQSGIAIEERLKSKVLLDVTLTEEQAGVSSIKLAIPDWQLLKKAKRWNISLVHPYFEEYSAGKSYYRCSICDAKEVSYDMNLAAENNAQFLPSGNAYWFITAFTSLFDVTKRGGGSFVTFYRNITPWAATSSINTAIALRGNLYTFPPLINENYPPYLKFTTSTFTFEAGTRIYLEVIL